MERTGTDRYGDGNGIRIERGGMEWNKVSCAMLSPLSGDFRSKQAGGMGTDSLSESDMNRCTHVVLLRYVGFTVRNKEGNDGNSAKKLRWASSGGFRRDF